MLSLEEGLAACFHEVFPWGESEPLFFFFFLIEAVDFVSKPGMDFPHRDESHGHCEQAPKRLTDKTESLFVYLEKYNQISQSYSLFPCR